MAKIVWTRPGGGKVSIPMLTTDSNSVTVRRVIESDFNTFVNSVKTRCNIDITTGLYITSCKISNVTSADAVTRAAMLDYIEPNSSFVGETWTSGNLALRWTATTSGNETRVLGDLYIDGGYYNAYDGNLDGLRAYILFDNPFVYDTSSGKIIWIGTEKIRCDTNEYKFSDGSGSYTYSINDSYGTFINGASPVIDTTVADDPYEGGGYSGEGGGQGTGGQSGTGGNYDTTSDDMAIPNLPTSIATGTGLFTAYNPSASQLANFADKLWNKDPTTFTDWWRYFFGGDAFSAIIGLSMIPVAPTVGSSKNIYLGNWDTGASAPPITNQYKSVDFGSVTLSEFWGNSIDYSPYTRVQLALPYIGIVDVDTDDVIGSVNTLSYHIDVLSGAFTAMLECVKGELDSVIYEWSGSCAAMLPISGASFNALGASILGMVGAAGAVGATALTGGSAAALAAGGLAMTGSAVSTFGSQKGKVQKSGSVSGNAGALGIQTPYFIISRPVQSVPSTQQATKGYPANISAHLGDLLGYTELSEVHLHDIPGTKDEVLEIETLLKKGVIF